VKDLGVPIPAERFDQGDFDAPFDAAQDRQSMYLRLIVRGCPISRGAACPFGTS
jgi:hypothetical protein